MNKYLTEEELDKIKCWDVNTKERVFELLDYIEDLWQYSDSGFKRRGKNVIGLQLHTGGWSGNESIIDALRDNTLFWSSYWISAHREGHYYFKIKLVAEEQKGRSKFDRKSLIQHYWEEDMTLREIGELYGVSHEYVRISIKKFGIEKMKRSEFEHLSDADRKAKIISVSTGMDYCLTRNVLGLPSRKDLELQRNLIMAENKRLSQVTLICYVCEKEFTRSQKAVINNFKKRNQQHFFCSKSCQGIHVAEHYGFKAHPENSGGGIARLGKRQHSYETIWGWHKLTGYSGTRLSRHLGISSRYIDGVIHGLRYRKFKLESEIKEIIEVANANEGR